jgi:hypothetical protein
MMMLAALIPNRRAWDGDAAPQEPRLAPGAALLIVLLLSLALWAVIWATVGAAIRCLL